MKKKNLLLMMLCASSSLCHAQKIKFEYDSSGNIVSRYVADKYESVSFGNYELRVSPSPTKGPLNIKVLTDHGQRLVSGRMDVIIRPAQDSSYSGYSGSFDSCDASMDISSPYLLPKGVCIVIAFVYPEGQKNPTQVQLKIVKK